MVIVPLAVAAEEAGRKVHKLNIGQPDLSTPGPMWDAILKDPPRVIAYSPSDGIPELRRSMAGYYERNEIPIRTDQIIITTGASEALCFAVGSITDPGDEILIADPLYANYIGFSHLLGVKVVPVPTRPEDGYHLPPREVWESKLSSKTRGIVVCNPGNPTGTVYRPDEVEMILDIAKDWGLFVLADEVYREFCFDGETHRSFMHYPESTDRIILVDSISKRFSACGARIGSVATTNADVYKACLHFAQAPSLPTDPRAAHGRGRLRVRRCVLQGSRRGVPGSARRGHGRTLEDGWGPLRGPPRARSTPWPSYPSKMRTTSHPGCSPTSEFEGEDDLRRTRQPASMRPRELVGRKCGSPMSARPMSCVGP